MTQRDVKITETAFSDLFELDYTIRREYQVPLTAKRYITGLKKQINGLSKVADLSVAQEKLSEEYGKEIRRENYKEK